MKKIFFTSLAAFALFFVLHTHNANAMVIKDSSSNTGGSENAGCTTNGGTDWCKAGLWPQTIIFSPTSNLGSSNILGSVTVWLTSENYTLSNCSSNCWFKMVITDGNGHTHTSTTQKNYSDVANNSYTQITFEFSPSDTIDFADSGGDGKLYSISWSWGNSNFFTRPALTYQFAQNTFSGFNLTACGSGNSTTCPGNVAPRLKIEDGTPEFAITNPLNNSTIQASDNFQITGTCSNNGANKLAFRRDILNQFETSNFNIDCTDGQFSFQHKIDGYYSFFYIVDKTDGSWAHVSFTVVDDPNVQTTIPNKLQIIYPPTDSPNHYTVHPDSEFPFRFKYTFKNRNDYNTAVFRMSDCTSITFVSCTLGANFYVKNEDTKPNGNFDVLLDIADGETYYFSATLYDTYPSPTWSYTINWIVVGDNDSTVLPDAGDAGGNCTNFLCDLFIPSSFYWEDLGDEVRSSIGDKIPFSYYYTMQDSFQNLDTAATTGALFDTDLDVHTQTGDFSIPFHAFDTGDSNVQGIFDIVRPWITTFLWIWFGLYLATRALRFFRDV